MIGHLLYLTASHLDISYVVGVCALFQSDPHSSHLLDIKWILKYVHGTHDYGIFYSFDTNSSLLG